MGRLFHSERGRFLIHNNEEITRWRRVKKELTLPSAAAGESARLWLLVNEYADNRVPLQIEFNGKSLASLPGGKHGGLGWRWRSVDVPARLVKAGPNTIKLSSASLAMNSWMLAIEGGGHRDLRSWLSTDDGKTWQNEFMGAHHGLRGEYIVRLRSLSPKLRDPEPARPVYEDPNHPRVRELAKLVPANVRGIRDTWKKAVALREWVCSKWVHDPFGAAYSPWDPWTVLEWTRRGGGHGQATKIAMCVHFGSTMAALGVAIGLLARPVVMTEAINTMHGHFVTEAFDEKRGKWVLHDPNVDVHFEAGGVPMSAVELCEAVNRGETLRSLVKPGPCTAGQPPHIKAFIRDVGLTGLCFRHIGLWLRNDYVSHPEVAPPNHGTVQYAETDSVWWDRDGKRAMEMFPWGTRERDYFAK